uniref:Uncharacterized protein n=1 Tax=Anguilla anguilla TaxID=7936 RepID=A0A0E9RW48_ANGAN
MYFGLHDQGSESLKQWYNSKIICKNQMYKNLSTAILQAT